MVKRRKKKQDEITEIPLPDMPATAPTPPPTYKGMPKEAMQMGRIMGNIKTSGGGQVLQMLKAEAAKTGRKEHEVLRDWITNYQIMRFETWNSMTVSQLYEAWTILKEMQIFAASLFFQFAKIMFSGQMTTFAEIIEEAAQRRAPTTKAKEKAIQRMMDSFEPVLNVLGSMMQTSLAKAMGIKQPKTKLNIPVTLKTDDTKP